MDQEWDDADDSPVLDARWGLPVSWPGRCVHPVAISVGYSSGPWTRQLDLALRRRGVVHWKIVKDAYLPWLPRQASAMIVIRHVHASEELDRVSEELTRYRPDLARGMLVVMPWDRWHWHWALRELGAIDVQCSQMIHVPRVAKTAQRFLQRVGQQHPDPPVPACWLAPSKPILHTSDSAEQRATNHNLKGKG